MATIPQHPLTQDMYQDPYAMSAEDAYTVNMDVPTTSEEPMYVNSKQYNRILRRRDTRARWEQNHRILKRSTGYIHESRHRHAMRRPRGPGGRFLSAAELAALDGQMKNDLELVGNGIGNHVMNNSHLLNTGLHVHGLFGFMNDQINHFGVDETMTINPSLMEYRKF